MKKGVLYFSITVMLISGLYMAYFYAMESGRVSPSKDVGEASVKNKGKRLAEKQPEGESAIKKEKTETTSLPYQPIIKELIENRYVANPNTGDYDIKPEVVEKIIINNDKEPGPFSRLTFQKLIKLCTAQGLYYILATITTQEDGVEKIECYDAYQLLLHVFQPKRSEGVTSYVQDQFFHNKNRRYNEKQNNSIFGTHPITKQPIYGPIKFYMIKDISDPAFIFIGSDYDLHANSVTRVRLHIRRLLLANEPDELMDSSPTAEEKEKNRAERAANQMYLGINYLKEKQYDEALHYLGLAEKNSMTLLALEDGATGVYALPEDASILIGLVYYQQKKYDEAFNKIKKFLNVLPNYNNIDMQQKLGYPFDICSLLGTALYHEKKYEPALACLRQVKVSTPKIEAMIKECEAYVKQATSSKEEKA